MGRALQILGGLILLGTVAGWLAGGAHRGWTRTSVPVRTLDEITGIEAIRYERRFVPGVDLLAGGLAAGAALVGISLLLRSPNKKPSP